MTDSSERASDHRTPTPGRIVGIGASAGGLESLEHLFSSLPADTGLAFVVVQHLSPDFRSLMDELIARYSEMPVVIAENDMPVLANRIHLLPPKKEMIIRDRRLVLTDKEAHTFTLPIDTFLRSLAQDAGPLAIAVILSGSGSDGSRGVVEIKRAGGVVLAETAASAKFDGMPLAAAATGTVDHAHPPRDLARILCGLPPVELAQTDMSLSDDPAMDSLLRLLRDHFGIDFSLYKTSTVGRRIQRRLDMLQIDNLAAYVDQVRHEPSELDVLYRDLLIGVTQFFRDPDAFELLEREVLPQLLDKVPPDDELRVWIAGCGTGEEAYSIAMLLWEQFAIRERPVRMKILATDVHQTSLELAGAGVYAEEQLQHVAPHRMQRFFTRRSSAYQISQDLRQLIVFARHNVTKDAPFTKMHMITCRNLLIYLQPHAQRTVLSLFHFGLVNGGVLFLGPSETPGPLSEELVAIDEHWKLYRKRRDIQLASHMRMPLHRNVAPRPVDVPRAVGPEPLILATYDQLLDRFMPPGFLIDEQRMLVDSFAGAERLLRVPRRRPSSTLLELLDEELRPVIAGAIQRALVEKTAVAYSGVPIAIDGAERRCTLRAEPLLHPRTNTRHVIITFDDLGAPSVPASEPRLLPVDSASRDRMNDLESELAYSRETLQATIEELETSNEEMQATNEELIASNEELQSTNEELHSVNEELYTVNAEYQQKIGELRELNTDMAHLIEGTDVGTLFLDRDLRIRRFTSRIATVFRIQASDVGREILDFSHNIERPTLMDEIQQASTAGTSVEDEAWDRAGVPYFLRILPYRMPHSGDASHADIQGVVLTLTDMSALDKARSRLAQLSAIVESSEDAIVGKALDGTIVTWNRGAERMYGYTAEEAVGKNVRMLMAPGSENELEGFVDRIVRGEKLEAVHSMRVRKDGSGLDISVSISPIFDRDGALVGLSAIGRDISPMLAAQRELQERQREIETLLAQAEQAARRREQFIAMLSHELRNPLAAVISATAAQRTSADEAIESPGSAGARSVAEERRGEVIERCNAVIGRQAAHMKRLLDDLLDVSRITRGKFELRKEPLDLRQPIEAAIESTSPLFEERGVHLVHQIPAAALPVQGDANRLVQVVVNLLSNAANYSPRNSVVDLLVSVDGDAVVVRVIDRGVGIELELQPKIFELFVQSEQRLDRSRGGLGVGLSLARTIVQQHGGEIAVRSDGLGKGTELVFHIPLEERAQADAKLQPERATAKQRIVLVDDQDDSREMLRMLLEARDHVVLDAADGPSAIELIEREKPDVAFIDIGLPTMTGYEVAQRIRQRTELDEVRLVALTGYGSPGDISAARAAGFDEHVIKPAELSRLEAILARKKPQLRD